MQQYLDLAFKGLCLLLHIEKLSKTAKAQQKLRICNLKMNFRPIIRQIASGFFNNTRSSIQS